MKIMSSKEFLESKGLKNPPLDSGISGGGDAPRIRVSDIMKEYAAQFIDLAAEEATVIIKRGKIPSGSIRAIGININKESILNIKKQIK